MTLSSSPSGQDRGLRRATTSVPWAPEVGRREARRREEFTFSSSWKGHRAAARPGAEEGINMIPAFRLSRQPNLAGR